MATTQTISVNTTGIYSVTASDNTGCSNSNTTIVTVNPSPLIPVITKNGNNLTSNTTTGNQWYRNDTLLTGDTLQTYTALINGNYKVIVTNNGCTATSSGISVNVGINDKYQAPSTQFQVFPNPSDGNFDLQLTTHDLRLNNAELRIYNVLGEKVYQQTLNTKQKTLNTKLMKGVYFLQLTTDEGVWNEKIIINY